MPKKVKNENSRKHNKVQAWKFYKVEGGKLTRLNKTCPKCRKFLAKAQNREFCGGCGYTVFAGKPKATPEQKAEKPVEKPKEASKTEEKPKTEEPKAEEKPAEPKPEEAEKKE